MSNLFNILSYTPTAIEKPITFGTYHIISFSIFMLIFVGYVLLSTKLSDKQFRISIIFIWVFLLLMELWKQYLYTCVPAATNRVFYWAGLPFQFCSSPLYILPVVGFLKDCKVRDAFIGFSSFFMFFAGLSVMVYPGTAFSSYKYINIQTMFHHGFQAITGFTIGFKYLNKYSLKLYLRGFILFTVFLIGAVILNEVLEPYFAADGYHTDFFFISPYTKSQLPILRKLDDDIPNIINVLLYYVVFAILGFIIYIIELFIYKKVKGKDYEKDKKGQEEIF